MARGPGDVLSVFSMPNNMNPLTEGMFPILVYDAWEHSYIQKYGSDEKSRAQALEQWWSLVEWDNVDALDRYWKNQVIEDAKKADEKSRQKPWKRPEPNDLPMIKGAPSGTGIPRPVKGEPLDLTKYGRMIVGVKPDKPPKKVEVKKPEEDKISEKDDKDSKKKGDVEQVVEQPAEEEDKSDDLKVNTDDVKDNNKKSISDDRDSNEILAKVEVGQDDDTTNEHEAEESIKDNESAATHGETKVGEN